MGPRYPLNLSGTVATPLLCRIFFVANTTAISAADQLGTEATRATVHVKHFA